MALIDVVKWDNPGDLLVWKFPATDLTTMTQLIVNESQTAILFKDGKQLDVFAAGRHTLKTNNIPLLNKIINLPFGGVSPFAAEVWYCNRAVPLDLKWGTATPLQLEDPQYGLVVPVTAYGQTGVRIADPALFVKSIVGTMPNFSTRSVMEYFKGVLISQLKSAIAQAIVRRQVPILQIEAELVTLSEDLQTQMQGAFAQYGLEVQLFRIMSISIPEDDIGVQELKKAKATAARRKIEGTTYQQERQFDVLQTGAGASGLGGAMAQVGIGLALGQSVAAVASQQMASANPQAAPAPPVFPSAAPPPFGQPTAPNHQYFVHLNGQQVGPYPFATLQQGAAAGQFQAQSPVWREGLPAWQPAGTVPELAPLFATAPPPFGVAPSGGPPPFPGA
jgi:membrane protease subunit (stomatin/prohibitin family)